ncbi:MAG: hypothetical protein K2X87_00405 [Gemmataceae bacterium]|nr:hypothetical protein [Gemmataceae bacterium]
MNIQIENTTVSGGTVTITVSNGPVVRYKVGNGPTINLDAGQNPLVITLPSGTHTVTVKGPNGSTAQTTVTVP